MAVATLVAVLLVCMAGVAAVSLQLRCIDGAREAARLAARGDGAAAAPAAGLVPPGATLEVLRDGGYVVARVRGRVPLLPGLVIVGYAVAAAEPGL